MTLPPALPAFDGASDTALDATHLARLRTDPAWLDAQYDVLARVSDHDKILGRWAAASALVRAQAPMALDIPYGNTPLERLDVYTTRAAQAPVLVFLHGGYWRSMDKADHAFIAPVFTEAGALVVVPNHGLCPQSGIAQIAQQVAAALAWVWRHAASYGGDPRHIVVVGHAAGAHLAAMMLSCRWKLVSPDLPTQLVSGALGISGLYDLEPLRLAPFLQKDLQLTPQGVARLSPAFFPRPKGKLAAVVGADESDEFRRQTQLIRDQWGPTTVPVCEAVPDSNHFSVLHALVDPSARLHEMALRLLGLHAVDAAAV